MTTLAAAGGRLVQSSGPRSPALGGGSLLDGPFRPLWTGGDQSDAFGYHGEQGTWLAYDGAYSSFPTVYAVVNKLVRQISTIPLKVYRQDDEGDKQRIRPDSTDPGASLARLLEYPTQRCGPVHLKQWLYMSALIFGNSLLAKIRGEGADQPPTELLPFDWRYVTGYAPPGGVIEVWGSRQIDARERLYDAMQTIHLGWGAPCGQVGVSPLAPLAQTLRLENASVRTQTANFRNGVKPSGFLIPGDVATVTKETLSAMKAQVESILKGPDNYASIMALAPGSTFEPLHFDSVEAELLASRVFNRVEVCIAYDVKPSHIGDPSSPGAGYSSVVEVNRDLYRTTLRPWLVLGEETLKAQLIDTEPAWEGLFVEFDMGEQLKGDPESVAKQIAAEIASGTMTINEGRSLNNRARDENPEADQLWLPRNNLAPIAGAPEDTPAGQEPAAPAAADQSPSMNRPRKINVIRDQQGRVTSYERVD